MRPNQGTTRIMCCFDSASRCTTELDLRLRSRPVDMSNQDLTTGSVTDYSFAVLGSASASTAIVI
eukprot:COSAG02_NODE_7618_length_2931_cov_186.388449_2_plen_65_part_00